MNNIFLNSFYSNSVYFLKERTLSTLTDKPTLIALITSIALGCLAVYLVVKHHFIRASIMKDQDQDFSPFNSIIKKDESEFKDDELMETPWSGVSRVLHERGLSEDFFNPSLYSPLQAAVLLQDLQLCKQTVKSGFSINFPEKTFKQPALAIALGKNSEEIDQDLKKKLWRERERWAENRKESSQEIALYLIENGAD